MNLRHRVIPVLSIINDNLVKTKNYLSPNYLGDPINAVKIFNGKMVDELIVIDIRASLNKSPINFQLLENIAQQAFMPLAYGGAINTIDEVKTIFKLGFEKVIFNTNFIENSELIKQSVIYAGSQSVVISLDFKKNILGIYDLYIKSGTIKVDLSLDKILNKIKALNVGEVIINLINKDGSMNGYDLEIISIISKMIDIPLIANSGAKDINDFKLALDQGAHSVAATSMFVYYGKLKAVLITFPSEKSLSAILGNELL